MNAKTTNSAKNTINRIMELQKIADETNHGIPELTTHDKKHKLRGIQSINTSVLLNPICRSRRKDQSSICAKCYAQRLASAYPALSQRLARNTGILTSHRLKPEEIPRFTSLYGRIESFGDVMNVTQAENYVDIIRNNPLTNFGIWSKNPGIWAAAFKNSGKPSNCTFVLSSPKLNERITLPSYAVPFTDHVFTVWDKGHESNCAGIECMSCLKCYKKSEPFYIDEIKR